MTPYPWEKKKRNPKVASEGIAVSGSPNIVCHSPFSGSNFVHAYAFVRE